MAIRDSRDKNWFWIENECIDLYTKHMGVFSIAVYLSLCRHADNETQQCFPSMDLISDELGISKSTVVRSIKTLQEWNFISVVKSKKEDGTQANNIYTLISSKLRRQIPSVQETIGSASTECPIDTIPSVSQDSDRVSPVVHNNTQTNNKTQFNNTQEEPQKRDPHMVKLFEEFWALYPKKKAKAYTFPIWMNLNPKLAPKIIEDVKLRRATDKQWLKDGGEYVPHPSTYLHQKRWEDDITTVGPGPNKLGAHTPYTAGKYKHIKSLETN